MSSPKSCTVCGIESNLKSCSRCLTVQYCSRDHQQLDWKSHKLICKVRPISDMSVDDSAIVESVNYNPNNQLYSVDSRQANNGLNNNQNNDSLRSMRDSLLARQETICETIVRDLNQLGVCVIDDFLTNGNEILSEVQTLYNCGLFRAGQVVNNRVSNTHLIRGDHIVWVDGTEPMCANIGFLVQTLDSIIMRCNTMQSEGQFAEYRINRRTKAMIACYPGNSAKYVRHIDNPNNDGRCITSIYYLNPDYDRQRDGGVLRLFPQIDDGCVADIEPKLNRVIFFWSDRRNPHEVMPSNRLRFAITVWYFDAIEREKAIQRYKEKRLQYPMDRDLRPF